MEEIVLNCNIKSTLSLKMHAETTTRVHETIIRHANIFLEAIVDTRRMSATSLTRSHAKMSFVNSIRKEFVDMKKGVDFSIHQFVKPLLKTKTTGQMDVSKVTANYSTPTSVTMSRGRGIALEKSVASITAQRAFIEVKNGRKKKSRKAVRNMEPLADTLKRRPVGI